MQIIVGFSKSKSIWKVGSQVIRSVEKVNFSHAYIRYECPITSVMLVAQASHGLVNQCNFDIFKLDNIIVEEYEIQCNMTQFVDMLKFTNLNLGKPYSTTQIILIGIKKLFHIEIETNNQDTKYICSEWAYRICEMFGILYVGNLDYMTPSDLNKLVREKYGKTK
jgi:hypothetical protein